MSIAGVAHHPLLDTFADAITHEVSFPAVATHRDDPALWLFSGGTTGVPKAVVQTHGSFLNTTIRYAHETIGYSRGRHHGGDPEAHLRLRNRLQPLLPVLRRRLGRAVPRAPHPGDRGGTDRPPPSDDPHHGADDDRQDARRPGRRLRRSVVVALRHVGGRGTPRCSSTTSGRRPTTSNCSTGSAQPRCGTSS